MDTIEALTRSRMLSREKAIVVLNILNSLPESTVPMSADDVIIATIAIGSFPHLREHGQRWCNYYRGLPPVEVLEKGGGIYVLVSFDWNPPANPKIDRIETTRQNKKTIKANIVKMLSGQCHRRFEWAFLTKGGEKIYLRRRSRDSYLLYSIV